MLGILQSSSGRAQACLFGDDKGDSQQVSDFRDGGPQNDALEEGCAISAASFVSKAASLGRDQLAALWQSAPHQAFVVWLQSRRTSSRPFDPHSIAQYRSMFSGYLNWLQIDRKRELTLASDEDLNLFLDSKTGRSGAPASATTRLRYMRLIFSVYEHLRELGLCKQNPAESTAAANRAQDFLRPAPTILSEALMTKFIDWVNGQDASNWVDARDQAMRLLFLGSGVSVSEIQALSPANLQVLDDDAKTLVIDIKPHGRVRQHSVPVAPFARDIVLSWARRLARLAPTSKYLFPARDFGFSIDQPKLAKVSSPECYTTVQAALNAIGYERQGQGPQTLRNSFVAHQVYEGRDPNRITNWLGLRTNETVTKIALQVPVRADGVVPA